MKRHYLGVNVRVLQRLLLLCSAVLVAASVAISGVIGFIGLAVPHLMRMWLGPDHRGLSPVLCWQAQFYQADCRHPRPHSPRLPKCRLAC